MYGLLIRFLDLLFSLKSLLISNLDRFKKVLGLLHRFEDELKMNVVVEILSALSSFVCFDRSLEVIRISQRNNL